MNDHTPLAQLGRAVLDHAGALRFPAVGGSMSPLIQAGDVLVVAPLHDHPPRPGEILLVLIDGVHPTAHRLIAQRAHRGRKLLCLKGDSTGRWDRVVADDEVLGRVTALERAGQVHPTPVSPPRLIDRIRGCWHLYRAVARHDER